MGIVGARVDADLGFAIEVGRRGNRVRSRKAARHPVVERNVLFHRIDEKVPGIWIKPHFAADQEERPFRGPDVDHRVYCNSSKLQTANCKRATLLAY